MRVLGIDPGSRRIGFGVITHGAQPKFIDAGLLPISAATDPAALQQLRTELTRIITTYQPDIVGVERLFFTKNRTTGIAVSQARGVILECVTSHNIPLVELTPNQVKQGVTGSGNANKTAVAKMVRLILNAHALHLIDDAMDALAIALVTGQHARTN